MYCSKATYFILVKVKYFRITKNTAMRSLNAQGERGYTVIQVHCNKITATI